MTSADLASWLSKLASGLTFVGTFIPGLKFLLAVAAVINMASTDQAFLDVVSGMLASGVQIPQLIQWFINHVKTQQPTQLAEAVKATSVATV